jgi:hypothetical protein
LIGVGVALLAGVFTTCVALVELAALLRGAGDFMELSGTLRTSWNISEPVLDLLPAALLGKQGKLPTEAG